MAKLATPMQELLLRDHAKIRYLYKEFKQAPTAEMKQQLVYHLVRESAIHSAKEEEVLYPVIREVLGEDTFTQLLSDAQWDKDILCQISSTSAYKQGPALEQLVQKFMDQFEAHMQEEEAQLMPKLMKSPEVNMVELGMQFERAAGYAVSRPHPWAPNKAPYNWFSNRLAAPLDYLADLIRFAGSIPTVNPPDVKA